MSNITTDCELGKPSVSVRWPKGAVVKTDVLKNSRGRFIARVKVGDGEFFSLPSTHATEAEAQLTLKHYVAENSQ